MSVFNHLSVKWKIYLIAIISIIGFGGYLGFNVWVNSYNSKLLEGLRSVNFPVLEKANSNRVKLDRLSELLNSAVLTGEAEFISTAEASAQQMNVVFNEILVLVPDKKAEVEEIKKSFETYSALAITTAGKMLKGTDTEDPAAMEELFSAAEKKEAALTKLTTELDSFIKEAHENFSGNINLANANSETLLTSGFIIWIVNILILTATVYAIARIILSNINSVSESLHELAHGGGDFSKHITVASKDEIGKLATSFNELMDNLREKTNDLMSMMQNMHQGLFTITENETIHQEYAAYIEKIFETKNVAGANYADLLFDGATLGSDALNQIKVSVSSLLGSDEMMFAFNSHLLVKEYSIDKLVDGQLTRKIIELDWDPILSDGTIHKIMVTARDVTELKIMQAAAEEQKKELNIIGQILKASPEKFERFADNALNLLDKNEAIIHQHKEKNIKAVAELFVNMHTIKGNARTYNFSFITDPVHEAENIYDYLRKEDDYAWDQEKLLKDIEVVRRAVMQYRAIATEKLNFSNAEIVNSKNVINITRDVYEKIVGELNVVLNASELSKKAVEGVFSKFKQLDSVPFERVIGELLASLPSLARQLEKEPPLVDLNTKNLVIRTEFIDVINDVCTHLLRNSLDHGIETPQERALSHKAPQGVISMTSSVNSQNAILLLGDDGRGLNLKRIKQKALEANHLSDIDAENPQKIAECLFLSGVSTAENITAISGRGVGMDAVRQYLQQNGCNIELVLIETAKASDDFVPFTIKITLAPSIYEVLDAAA